MSKLFTSSGYAPSGVLDMNDGEALEFASMPPFLRVLLTTDGTVTKSLESFFWEPVVVEKVEQHRHVLEQDQCSIHKQLGDEVILRRVRLVGEQSDRCFARATSYICTDVLPDEIEQELELDRVGIGELLRECGLETYRELMSFNKGTDEHGDYIDRTYRIVMEKMPFIQITERFPISEFL